MTELDDDLDSFFGGNTPKKTEKVPEKTPEKPEKPPKKVPDKLDKEEEKPEESEKTEKKEEPTPDPEPPVKKEEPKKEPEKEPKEETPSIYKEETEFDTSPDDSTSGGVVITIYGRKGDGKSHLAFTLPGTHSCISFDRKSQSVAAKPIFSGRVTVYDGVKEYNKTDPDLWLETSTKSWAFVQALLDRIEKVDRPDWVDIDGGEIVHQMFEMVMRDRNDIRAFQGIANKNIWKYRKMLISQLLARCQEIAKRGVVWTSYIAKDQIKKDGDFVSIEDVPKWIDAVLYETDALVRAYRKTGSDGQQFLACVESSKWDALKNGPKVDVTDIGMMKLLSKEYLEKIGEEE